MFPEPFSPWGLATGEAMALRFSRLLGAMFFLFLSVSGAAAAQTITTHAGGGVGDEGEAVEAYTRRPVGSALDANGNLYFADESAHRVRKVDANGIITTVAGTGEASFSGDGGLATSATLNRPVDVAVDAAGNLFIADNNNRRVRKVTPAGVITTVAGNGTTTFRDNVDATTGGFGYVGGLAIDGSGNVYVADGSHQRIRRISTGGLLTTVAGDGTTGYSGDGGQATSASLAAPSDVAFDPAGLLHIADTYNGVVRKVAANGVISTVAGGGSSLDEGVPPLQAQLQSPSAIGFDAGGSLYVAETNGYRIRRVSGGQVQTVVGNGNYGDTSGDGGDALAAAIGSVEYMTVAPDGRIFLSSGWAPVRLAVPGGQINRYAGGGVGDGPVATRAILDDPRPLAASADGTVIVATRGRLRRISPTGAISTIAGYGQEGYTGDGGPAVEAQIGAVTGIVMAPGGEVFFSDYSSGTIRRIGTDGIIDTFAVVPGTQGLARDAAGNFYTTTGHTVVRISSAGVAAVFAGTGGSGFGGDGGQALQATFSYPRALASGPAGALYVLDAGNYRLRRIGADGVVTTVAGNGSATYAGPGLATSVSISNVSDLAVDVAGNVYLSHAGSDRVVKVTTGGQLVEFAGDGTYGFLGDGGPALGAQFRGPAGVAVVPVADGDVFISDEGNSRVRRVRLSAPATVPDAPGVPVVVAGDGMAVVSFQPPANDGGSPVTGYVVTSSPAGGVDENAGAMTLRRVLTGLANGTSYRFSVRAFNANGPSAPSGQSAPVVPGTSVSAPFLSAFPAAGSEGGQALFVVRLSRASANAVSFSLRTINGTATAGSDFTALSLVNQVIPAGRTAVGIPVTLLPDATTEGSETFAVVVEDVANAVLGVDQATGTIQNDDNPAPPVVAGRPDRFEQLENAVPTLLDVLGNDVFTPARLVGGSLAVSEAPLHGTASVANAGTPGNAGDDYILYTPPADFSGEDVFAYRLCDSGGVCDEQLSTVVLRPAPRAVVESATNIGSTLVPLSGLRPLEGAEFRATPFPVPNVDFPSPVRDDTPWTPWDAGQAGTQVTTYALPAPADGLARSFQVLVELMPHGLAEFDLYAGVDSNNDGLASESELRCSSARRGADEEACDFPLEHPGNGTVRYWVMAHNVDVDQVHARTYAFAVPLVAGDGTLVATGPAKLARGEDGQAIVGWDDPRLLDSGRRRGFVQVFADGGQRIGMFPAGVNRNGTESAAVVLSSGISRHVRLVDGEAQDRMFIDVPQGASSLTVTLATTYDTDLYLAYGGVPQDLLVAPAPARAQAQASAVGTNEDKTLTISGSQLLPGRWYVTPVNSNGTGGVALATVTATVNGAAPTIRSGSYFNPARSGHGIFLYPAADQRVGIWYTYLRDGSPTWYYLQATAPGANGIWSAPIYRSVWTGSSNKLTVVGQAVVTPTGPDTFRFTYSLDGEVGSESLSALGRGCPVIDGQTVDSSSHWFDPASAGVGYSVQYFPNYEFYAAFVYDGQGMARYLLAEKNGVGGSDATLALEQNSGFCPTCERLGTPQRSTVGSLRRVVSGGLLRSITIDATYTGFVPGRWSAQDTVQPLGGPGTTQGCAIE